MTSRSPRSGSNRAWSGRRVLTVVVAVCLLVLSGCVVVPTSGPAVRIEGQAPPCQNCVNVEVAPPAIGDEPKQIVDGYLRATSVYQPNYATAKQYLTKAAAEAWSPEDGARIYSGSTVANRNTVVLDGRLDGALGPDRTYTARNQPLKVDFGVVKEDGEWRISTPPNGLMIAAYAFSSFYRSYNLYFIGNGATLVPDPIYLPNLPDQANVASVLMKALLSGPSKWLQPAVASTLPVDTSQSVGAVTVTDGIAQVPLSDAVLPLNDRQRGLLAAQVVYTLKQATGVDGVLFTVNQKPFRVPGSDANSLEVAVDEISSDVDPVPFVAGDQLYAVRNRSVQLIAPTADSPDPRPMSGALGQGRYDVDSVAVSVANTDIAVVTDDRTVLRTGLTTNGNPATRLKGVSHLLRPQYTRYGELWALGVVGGRQRMWMFIGGKPVEVGAKILTQGTVTAFRISPDGTRMALVRTVGTRTELGLARITRADKVSVDGFRRLETARDKTLGISIIKDVGWSDATDLLVLGGSNPEASLLPYQVSEDASQISPPTEPNNWDAVEVTTLMGSETSVVIGRTGQTYKGDGATWLPFVAGCSTMAFPG